MMISQYLTALIGKIEDVGFSSVLRLVSSFLSPTEQEAPIDDECVEDICVRRKVAVLLFAMPSFSRMSSLWFRMTGEVLSK